MKEKARKSEESKEWKYFFIVVPILFVVMVFGYFLLDKYSSKNGKICNYLGKIWISLDQADTNVKEGCYTYEQLAKLGRL